VNRIVEAKNAELQSYARVKKFAILPEDFTVENGALTPTLKVKRKVISERFQDILDSLYR
jgi:long-chain acyl-CoA synthetase